MDDADEVLFENPLRLVMDDHVVEHVEQIGRTDFQPEFFGEFADDRFLVAFAVVDSPSWQIEFASERSTGLSGENDATIVQRHDGVRTGANRKNVCHNGNLRNDDAVPTVRKRGDLPGFSKKGRESRRIGERRRVVVIENVDLTARRKHPDELFVETLDV